MTHHVNTKYQVSNWLQWLKLQTDEDPLSWQKFVQKRSEENRMKRSSIGGDIGPSIIIIIIIVRVNITAV